MVELEPSHDELPSCTQLGLSRTDFYPRGTKNGTNYHHLVQTFSPAPGFAPQPSANLMTTRAWTRRLGAPSGAHLVKWKLRSFWGTSAPAPGLGDGGTKQRHGDP